MNVEARFLGGPGEGEIRAIPSVVPEIKIAHLPPQPYGWWDRGPEITPVEIETHIYVPARAVVYYEYRGKR